MKTNKFLIAFAVIALSLSSCVKDEIYVDDTQMADSDIVMNEVFSRGDTDNPDWVEIYNLSNLPIDISGYKIYDGGGQSGSKPKMEFPAGTTVPAKGFYVIVVDTDDAAGFGLSSGGDILWLENEVGEVIDNVEVPAMEVETTSYGRMPDGSENWQILETITMGAANDDTPAPEIPDVVMNEVFSKGFDGNLDWVEIFNNTDADIDISGYKIYDNGGESGSKPKKEFASGTILPANGFFVIIVDDEEDSGFGISSGGETLWLEDAEGSVIDEVEVPALEDAQSYGRYADGSANWQVLYYVTRGTANSDATSAPVIVMNEIFSKGTDLDPDWVELYNTSAEEVNISGYKIYDSGGFSGSKPKMTIPEGTTIAANSYFVIVVDTEDEAGFGLSGSGEDVWLEDANDNVIDFAAFPALEETQSFGRFEDGAYSWEILNTITKGAANAQ